MLPVASHMLSANVAILPLYIHIQMGQQRLSVKESTCRRLKESKSGGPLDRFVGTSRNEGNGKPTQERITELVLKFFISGNIAFAQAGNKYLNELIQLIALESGFAICPSHKVIRQKLYEYGEFSRDELHERLSRNDSKVSLALDCWSSRSNFGFMGTIDRLFPC